MVMKSTRLMIAAVALLGIAAACQKVETPVAQQEEPVVVEPQAPAQNLDVKSVATLLDELAEKEEVQIFIKDILVVLKDSDAPLHFDLEVSLKNEQKDVTYVSGSLGLDKGEYHPIAIDMNLVVLGMFPVVGQLDLVQVSVNYAKALLSLDDDACDEYLAKASLGLGIAINDTIKFCFLRGVNEYGLRTMSLYIYDATDPTVEPIAVDSLFKTIIAEG